MNYIKNKTNFDDIKLKEIEYGLVSIYLTFSKIIIVLILSFLLNIFKEVIIFMICFNILRTPAFGLHATKSWICLISSILIFIGLPLLCLYININTQLKLMICLTGTLFMFKNAPADTHKKPIVNKKRRLIYNTISTILAIVFSIISVTINDNFISNCLVFALLLENCLIAKTTYRIFKLPYNNYITFLEKHPEFSN